MPAFDTPTTHPSWCDHNAHSCYLSDPGTPFEAERHALTLDYLQAVEWRMHDGTVQRLVTPEWDELEDEGGDLPDCLEALAADARTLASWAASGRPPAPVDGEVSVPLSTERGPLGVTSWADVDVDGETVGLHLLLRRTLSGRSDGDTLTNVALTPREAWSLGWALLGAARRATTSAPDFDPAEAITEATGGEEQ